MSVCVPVVLCLLTGSVHNLTTIGSISSHRHTSVSVNAKDRSVGALHQHSRCLCLAHGNYNSIVALDSNRSAVRNLLEVSTKRLPLPANKMCNFLPAIFNRLLCILYLKYPAIRRECAARVIVLFKKGRQKSPNMRPSTKSSIIPLTPEPVELILAIQQQTTAIY